MEVVQLVGREITDSYPGTSCQEELTKPIPEAPPKITQTLFFMDVIVSCLLVREKQCVEVSCFSYRQWPITKANFADATKNRAMDGRKQPALAVFTTPRYYIIYDQEWKITILSKCQSTP